MALKNNFKTEILHISKVTKILEKGKMIRFKILVVTGNYKDTIGFGIGKDVNFFTAKKKAIAASYKKLIHIDHYKINKINSLPRMFFIKYKTGRFYFRPNLFNTGIRSGNLFFILFKLAGFNQVVVKRIKSKNVINNIYAFFKFLSEFKQYNKNYENKNIA